MQPHPDEYKDWLQHPVTEWVLDLMQQWAAHQKDGWADLAWTNGEIDPLLLREAQVRADCYESIPTSTLEDWLEVQEKLSDSES